MWNWLLRPPRTFRAAAALVLFTVLFDILWSAAVAMSLHDVMGPGYYDLPAVGSIFDPVHMYGHWVLVFLLFSVAFEESIRLLPLAIVVGDTRGRKGPVMTAVLLTAAGFGLLHLSNGLPLLSVLLCQGFCGMTFNLLYLKCGGIHRTSFKGYAAAYATHYLFDAALCASALLLNGIAGH